MLRSKSRSGSNDFGQKNHYTSVLSRTLSASKFCRGGDLVSQIDSNALKIADKKSSKKLSNRTMSMEKQKGELEAELHRTRAQLGVAEVERDKALDELREAKEKAVEASIGLSEGSKVEELKMELKSLKEILTNSHEELKVKDDKIKSLELELGKTKQFEFALLERDASLDKLKEEFSSVRESNMQATELLSEGEKKIRELEDQVERGKQSESKMIDLMEIKTKQHEQTEIVLEELKLETTSLREKIELLQDSSKQNSRDLNNADFSDEENEGLKAELRLTKENLARAQEDEKKASLKVKSLLEEMELLKNELKLAIDAEERSTNAMEDLALALKEVTAEANQTKEKLVNAQMELEQIKAAAEKLKEMAGSTDERHQKLLDEAKQEAELYKNTADRLRLEAEESILASNGKEMGFVSCIIRAEEEAAVAKRESARLAESLKAAEDMAQAARDETNKLRDILKQAINEANAAKAAADIARDENSRLKDCLSERDEALNFLTPEDEGLRINSKIEDKEKNGTFVDREHKENNLKKLEDLKFMNEHENSDEKLLYEDPNKAEALKGSIFYSSAETPRSELRTPKSSVSTHPRGYSSSITDNTGTPNSEDFDNLDIRDRNSQRRRKTMFGRVGDLLMIGRSFHRKEPSTESTPPAHP
ncbi:WEB family protein At5g16730, chloroplastic-like [Olea europaea var. sylvestris]|uniref:WEB family protein At5g16730, chloroplastic-like n=1 Tax=Olea europaea var. sylvestris TaxID=158386 RepID=UPI000C1D6C03|nr:WEB family protein At5g16730, chloroplastic-like [Olea europaea var. sylvestris]